MQLSTCLSCSEPLALGARFCGHCGTEAPVDAQNPEIRTLTIQFIDLVGSTAYANNAELETYDDMIAAFHRLVSDTVETYRGMVLQRYGDGVLACFGLGHDSEDAALCAIAAGLSIAKSAPDALQGQNIRVGIDSGQVMCRVGHSGSLYPQLAGLHVNRAARLQEQAPTGGVVISGETRSFLSRLAELEVTSERNLPLKGIDQPVTVIGVSGFHFLAREDHSLALFERDAELSALLDDRLRNAVLIGPAGIGKSALLSQLIRSLSPTPVIQMDARANLQQSALFPIAEALRAELALSATSCTSDFATALGGLGVQLDPIDQSLLAGVLGLNAAPVPLPPEQQKARRIAITGKALRALAHHRNAILAFDDFHWSDNESAAVLRDLINDEQFLHRLIITSRPGDAISKLLADSPLNVVELHPLSDAAARQALATYDDLSQDRKAAMIMAAEGNPLFLLALAEHARQMGHAADERPLPQTIEATFQALINGLGPLKDVVQSAAVLGRVFDPEHLALLMPDRTGLEDEIRVLTINGTFNKRRNGLAFDHVLLRDAAYEMLPGKRRRALHLQFADDLRRHDPALCAELPELVADHLLAAKAHDQIPAACINAGVRMLMSASFDSAIKYLDSARKDMHQQANGQPVRRDEHLPVLSLLASATVQRFGFSHPNVLESYEELEMAVNQAQGSERQRMIALYGLFSHRMISGKVRECGEIVDTMEQIARSGSPELTLLWLVNKTAYDLYSGHFDQAAKSSAALKDLYTLADHGRLFLELGADPLASVLSADTHILIRRGDKDGALRAIEQAKAHLTAIGARAQLPWIHIFGAQALFAGGYLDLANAEVQTGISIADEQRADFWSLNGRLWQVIFSAFEPDSQTPLDSLDSLVGHIGAIGANLNRPLYNAVRAKLIHRTGDHDTARDLLHEAYDLMDLYGEREWQDTIGHVRAEILAH